MIQCHSHSLFARSFLVFCMNCLFKNSAAKNPNKIMYDSSACAIFWLLELINVNGYALSDKIAR